MARPDSRAMMPRPEGVVGIEPGSVEHLDVGAALVHALHFRSGCGSRGPIRPTPRCPWSAAHRWRARARGGCAWICPKLFRARSCRSLQRAARRSGDRGSDRCLRRARSRFDHFPSLHFETISYPPNISCFPGFLRKARKQPTTHAMGDIRSGRARVRGRVRAAQPRRPPRCNQ